MTSKKLKEVLKKHVLWLQSRPGGVKADLSGANLSRANLTRASLFGANLFEANLTRANLFGASLFGANLFEANLSRANLSEANLSRAYMFGVNLTGVNLTEANLSEANLSRANLTGVNLFGANLTGANLTGARLPNFQLCPKEGGFVAWKRVKHSKGTAVLKLEIPTSAKRTSSLIGRKCRASEAKVVEVIGEISGEISGELFSSYDATFKYVVGQTVSELNFNSDIRFECRPGIHFFMTRKEAEEYRL